MKILVVVPTIRVFPYLKQYNNDFERTNADIDIIKVGETIDFNPQIGSYFGVKERYNWFKECGLLDYLDIIPIKHHAETNFGLLYALDGDYDYVLFIDDDTSPIEPFLQRHINILNNNSHKIMTNRWVNVLGDTSFYPRGFPYGERNNFVTECINSNVVLNQGLWLGHLDCNAEDYPDGKNFNSNYSFDNIVAPRNLHVTISSMNCFFSSKIIPAFYQPPYFRYDDIFSGLFVKKVIDANEDYVSFGEPYCYHHKEWRQSDVSSERFGYELNERLFKYLDETKLTKNNYADCYSELGNKLQNIALKHKDKDLINITNNMLKWTQICDIIK